MNKVFEDHEEWMLHELNAQRVTDSLDVVFKFPNESDKPDI